MLKYWETNGIKDSFSLNHTMPYSCICVQGMNLAYHYPIIFWNCACLSINSGGGDEDLENKSTEYGRIATAIGNIQKAGQKIVLPNINKAHFGFFPDLENDEIIFGLKGIQGVNDKVAKAIIAGRPYVSAQQFYNYMQIYKQSDDNAKFGDGNMTTLIKAGCFDDLEEKPRSKIMRDFIQQISKPLKSLSWKNVYDLKELGLLTEEQIKYEYRLIRFRDYVYSKEFFAYAKGKSASTNYYRLDRKFSEPYFFEHFETEMVENKDYEYDDNGFICVKRGSFDKVFEKLTADFKAKVIDNPENLKRINEIRYKDIWEQKASGSIPKWEMDSISFYYTEHELAHINREYYNITNFFDLLETPEISNTFLDKNGVERHRYKLFKICGTVLDKNKNKHLITLLTPEGVVPIKFQKGQFSFYDRQISSTDEDTGSKSVEEKSWFKRGNKLIVTGYRSNDQFIAKKYNNSVFRHCLQIITDIKDDGSLSLQSERTGYEEEVR